MTKFDDLDRLDAVDDYLLEQYTQLFYKEWSNKEIQTLRLDAMKLFKVFISTGYIKDLLELPND